MTNDRYESVSILIMDLIACLGRLYQIALDLSNIVIYDAALAY